MDDFGSRALRSSHTHTRTVKRQANLGKGRALEPRKLPPFLARRAATPRHQTTACPPKCKRP
eukprot:7030416-Alexandrium_andersonii.AAC.1